MKVRKIVVRVDKDNAEIFYADRVETQEGAVIVLDENELPLAVFLTWQYWRYMDEPKEGHKRHQQWSDGTDFEITGTGNYWSMEFEPENKKES